MVEVVTGRPWMGPGNSHSWSSPMPPNRATGACGYGRSGRDFERFRELERLRAETDVDGVVASDEVVQPQACELVRS